MGKTDKGREELRTAAVENAPPLYISSGPRTLRFWISHFSASLGLGRSYDAIAKLRDLTPYLIRYGKVSIGTKTARLDSLVNLFF